MVRPLVAATMTTIRTLKDHPGEQFKSLPDVFQKLREFHLSAPTDEQMERYVENIYKL